MRVWIVGPMGFSLLPTIRQTVAAKAMQEATQKAEKALSVLSEASLPAYSSASATGGPAVVPTSIIARKSKCPC